MKNLRLISIVGLILFITMIFSGCSGDGKGGSSGAGSGSTVISGKVTLSGSIASGKPNLKTMFSVPGAKPGTKTYREASTQLPTENLSKVYFAAGDPPSPLGNATVELYDADHPEWLYPVSVGVTDSSGNYSLSTMANSSRNAGSSYQDGDPIPVGKYTLIAFKNVLGQKPVVAVQTIVTEFEGTVPSVNFEVLDSDAAPSVISILGLPKNKDGSQTWGSTTTVHPANSAIQATFSMPMMREYLSAITIASSDGGTVPTGVWTLSADWMTATYYFDEGQTLTVGNKYTITIYGDNDTGNHPKVVNVYGNTVETTSTCSFTASALDDLSPSVQWNSPTVIEMGALVDVTQSFRVESNEILDVNNLSLKGSPSIGVKPGVLFLGRNSKGLYVYEFDLGAPLMLNTSYSVTVTGGKDLAGHTMNVLAGNIRTNSAANTAGIDPLATAETQNLQAAVKAIFGKWVRSLDDRNLAQFQGMMSPEFYMEYDVTKGIDSTNDLNRDGRFSFAEFSRMIGRYGFLQWDYCGTSITGTISPVAGTSINLFPGELPPRADFEFKLNATNTLNSKECAEAAPRESLYATLQYKNGTWKIVRASTGIDNRNKTISSAELLTSYLHQINNADSLLFSTTSDPLTDGYKFDGVPNSYNKVNSENIAINYKWDAMPGVTTYVLIVMDARTPWVGRAVAFPSSVTSVRTDKRWVADLGGTDVAGKFGFNTTPNGGPSFSYMGGGQYYWEVIGLSTIQSADVPSKSRSILLQDIKAASFLRSFRIAGSFDELLVQVKPGTNPSATPIPYSEILSGYDLKNNGWVTLTLYSPNKIAAGSLSINGSQSASYTLNFDTITGQAETTIALYQGTNWVSVCNNGDDTANPPKPILCKSFSILTTGGIPPVIQIWEVIDDSGATLVGDSAGYFVAPTAQKVTIKGIVTDSSVTQLSLNLWNQDGAYGSAAAPVTCDVTTCTFSFDNFEIYKGENWINLYGSGAKSYQSYIGIYTDTGTTWVPPISVTTVSESTPRGSYPNSSDWDATPGSDYMVTISGKLKIPSNGTYYTWSEGGYSNGTLNVLSDGTFNLNVLLYTGWNYVSLYDSTGAWYGVNIYTTAGKPVIKPQVTNTTVTGCTAQIDGTAVVGAMYVNVSGYGLISNGSGSTYYGSFSEYQNIQSTGSSDPGNFMVYVPVASGSGAYTYIDIYDKDYKSAHLQLTTSSTCAYVPPSSTFEGVKDDGLATVNSDGSYTGPNDYGYYLAGNSKTVTLHGTSNRPGYAVNAFSETCGNRVSKTVNASLTPVGGSYPWSITMNVYGNYNSGYNYINLNDSTSSKYIYVRSTNTEPLPPPPLTAIPTPGTYYSGQCNQMQYKGVTGQYITIAGSTTAPDGTGYYRDALNANRPFDITGGNYTITNVKVYNGWNNFTITDTNYNYFYLNVETTNGDIKPKFVEIKSPLNNASVSNSTTINGEISDPVATGYAPKTVYATVYNSVTSVSTQYSSDLYEQQTYGYGALLYSGSTYTFTHDFASNTGSYSYIEVYAYDNVNGINHGHTIYVNTGGTWSDYYYKPGVTNTIASFKKKVDDKRRFEWEMQTMLRSW